jgi:RNA polymerase sigma-70 factor (ECF subfamily)
MCRGRAAEEPMENETRNERLSQISTRWTLLDRVLHGPAEGMASAQEQMFERYSGAIRRYLLGSLHDEEAAEELAQEFALCFLERGLGGYDPERGRFRDYVKGVLFHLIADYHKERRQQPLPLAPDYPEPAVEDPSLSQQERDFLLCWRDELLARTWSALADVERTTGQPFYTVLRFRADHPVLPSPRIAQELTARLGKPLKAAAVRQTLHRARQRFAELLLEEVAESLKTSALERIEQELSILGLLDYCRPALQRGLQCQ